MTNSIRSRWKLAEQTVIRVRESEGDIHQLTPTPEKITQGLGEQMQNSNEV